MGQPIILKKKGESDMIVYGRAEAAVYMADGWLLEGMEEEASPTADDPAPVVSEPKPKTTKAKAKK